MVYGMMARGTVWAEHFGCELCVGLCWLNTLGVQEARAIGKTNEENLFKIVKCSGSAVLIGRGIQHTAHMVSHGVQEV